MTDLSTLSNEDLTRLYHRSTGGDPRAMSDEELKTAYSASAPVSAVGDLSASAAIGPVKGATKLLGLPGDLGNLWGDGVEAALGFVANKMGLPPHEIEAMRSAIRESNKGGMLSSAEVRQGLEKATGPLYEPKTQVGKYAENVTEGVPSALMGPGGIIRNLINFAVLPGIVGEAADDAAKGTPIEKWAKPAASIVTGGAAALLNRPNVAGSTISNATRGTTEAQLDAAERLFQEAQHAGAPITRAEALQQVTQGATRLGDVQRVVEGSGGLKQELAARPQQIETAGRRAIDAVSPPNAAPSTIGPAVGTAAEGTINDVRGAINAHAAPDYAAASGVILQPAVMAHVSSLPGWPEAAHAVRADPQLNRYVANLPDNSVGFINEVKKYLDQAATNARAPVNAQQNMQRSAGYGLDANAVRDAGTRASPDYALALISEAENRARYLDPLLAGPLGKIAARDTTTQQAIEALFPRNPLPNSADEITTAIGALAQRNPNAARSLVGAHIESVFNQATRDLQGGPNQWGGAGFAAAVRGNPQQAANLEAAIRALPAGNVTWEGFDRFLQIMEAQGQRQRIGSQTAFNQEMQSELRRGGTVGEAMTIVAGAGLKWPQRIMDVMQQWRLGSNVDELARLITDPAAGPQFRRLALAATGEEARVHAMRIAYLGRDAISKPSSDAGK